VNRSYRTIVAIALATAAVALAAKREPAVASRPRLVVLIAVDGLSWNRLASWRPWFTAGFKTLLDGGAVATECRYGHLNTETGPGHASIATGAPPRLHGIGLNQWYVPAADGSTMLTVYCADEPVPAAARWGRSRCSAPRGSGWRRSATGSWPPIRERASSRCRSRTGPQFSWPGATRVMRCTGTKRRMGRSRRAPPTTPRRRPGAAAAAVVARFDAVKAAVNVPVRYGTTLDRLPLPDTIPELGFETGFDAFRDPVVGHGFPKDLTVAKRSLASALRWTPLADRMLADLALDFIDDDALGLGRDAVPDVLAMSFSANDYAAHYYGPESVESLEVLRGLDVQLGRLLDELVRRLGRDAIVLALSADHGMLPLPEAAHREFAGLATSRVKDTKIVAALNAAVVRELGLDAAARPVYRLEGCSLWLDRAFLATPGRPLPIASRRSCGASWRRRGRTRSSARSTWRRRCRAAVPCRPARATPSCPGVSGDLFVIPRPGVLIDPYEGTGTSHGTPWDYDTHVPLIFWGGGITPAAVTRPATPYDIAPTVASWLGISLPDATGARMDVRGAKKAGSR
jgi:hypothetical protein